MNCGGKKSGGGAIKKKVGEPLDYYGTAYVHCINWFQLEWVIPTVGNREGVWENILKQLTL